MNQLTAYSTRMADGVKELAKSLPLAWDTYAHFWRFHRDTASCRGVFCDFAHAIASVPRGACVGHDQREARIRPERFDASDYPMLMWLYTILLDSKRVFDLGGNIGSGYYTYREKVRIPVGVSWTVCDVPDVVEVGERMAAERNVSNLRFTTRFEDASGCDALLTCGTLQYIEEDLAQLLGRLRERPRHVLVNQVPFHEKFRFVTLQNLGYSFAPYCIRGVGEFVAAVEALGYRLIDSWRNGRCTKIPFHPELTVRGYRGFYFTAETPSIYKS